MSCIVSYQSVPWTTIFDKIFCDRYCGVPVVPQLSSWCEYDFHSSSFNLIHDCPITNCYQYILNVGLHINQSITTYVMSYCFYKSYKEILSLYTVQGNGIGVYLQIYCKIKITGINTLIFNHNCISWESLLDFSFPRGLKYNFLIFLINNFMVSKSDTYSDFLTLLWNKNLWKKDIIFWHC